MDEASRRRRQNERGDRHQSRGRQEYLVDQEESHLGESDIRTDDHGTRFDRVGAVPDLHRARLHRRKLSAFPSRRSTRDSYFLLSRQPTTCTFGGYCGYQSYFGSSGPPKSTYRAKRDVSSFPFASFTTNIDQTAPLPVPVQLGFEELTRPVKRGPLNPNGWVSEASFSLRRSETLTPRLFLFWTGSVQRSFACEFKQRHREERLDDRCSSRPHLVRHAASRRDTRAQTGQSGLDEH